MISVPVYDRTGQRIGEESIDPADFGGAINKQLLHDVVVMHQANRRVGTVNTRGRADVAGSGKKLFRQKGTGNARVGAKRTNKRKGGGVAFARRNRDYRYRLPKRAVRQAIRMAVLSKFLDQQAIVIDGLVPPPAAGARPKTKDVVAVLRSIPQPDHAQEPPTPAEGESKAAALRRSLASRSLLIGLAEPNPTFYLSARNLEGVMVAPVAEFNTLDVLKQRYLVLTRESLAALKERARQPLKPRRRTTDAATA
ncbi:MAG: 50S ribosomal protein L4 [Isosphaeraceae bacterium]|jgi:large subunit ribosomal protein L4|nr:MAG: 50S ribosomal protein L4 [Isosphaeraceae bacterium]